MNPYLKLFFGILFVLALAGCGGASQAEIPPQSADVSLDCNKTTGWCLGEVTNNSETESMVVKPAIDVAYKGSEVQMDEDHVNPIGQTWSNFFYFKDEVAYYRIQPGEKLPFKWRGNPGLYRFTVNTSGYGDTITYSYTGYTPTLSNESLYRVSCKPDSITVTTSSTSYTGWGTAIYINDQRWGVIVDVANQLTEIELPRPEFNVDPKRININTDKWDDLLKLNVITTLTTKMQYFAPMTMWSKHLPHPLRYPNNSYPPKCTKVWEPPTGLPTEVCLVDCSPVNTGPDESFDKLRTKQSIKNRHIQVAVFLVV